MALFRLTSTLFVTILLLETNSAVSRSDSDNENSNFNQGSSGKTRTGQVITTPTGRPSPSLTASKAITAGRESVIVLEDVNLINILAHADREQIPERIGHAKGTGAHGYFEVTHDISHLTHASLFSHIGKRTPATVRFSSTVFEKGSADTIMDRRGFAVKFYTDEGNWDLVGTNFEIFPNRDPILVGNLIHAFRRNPKTGRRDVNATWDFVSLRPECTHFVVQLLSDRGFPQSFRFMDGGGVNTFKLVNGSGSIFYVKFHWRTNQGFRFMTLEKSLRLAGLNPDYYAQDLFLAIANGDFPSWNLTMQVLTPEQAKTYRWNPFDATKIILEKDFPSIPVGRLVLNENPTDFFNEVEQFAVCPSNLVPGIEMSPDPLLVGRAFAYLDTQRYRLGVNFMQLPVNRPRVPVNTFDRDGKCAVNNGQGRPNYFPNSVDGSFVSPRGAESVYHIDGDVVREDVEEDNFSQAKIYIDELTTDARERLAMNFAFFLVDVRENIVERVLRNLHLTEPSFAEQVRRLRPIATEQLHALLNQ